MKKDALAKFSLSINYLPVPCFCFLFIGWPPNLGCKNYRIWTKVLCAWYEKWCTKFVGQITLINNSALDHTAKFRSLFSRLKQIVKYLLLWIKTRPKDVCLSVTSNIFKTIQYKTKQSPHAQISIKWKVWRRTIFWRY